MCIPIIYNSGVTKQEDLIVYVFEGEHSIEAAQRDAAGQLSGELLQWMDASGRFTAFVETYRDKIRKKIRVTREPESMLDVRGELEVACGLLSDRRLEVAYEPYASAKKRGPDFAVTYRTNLVFNIEVARIRVEDSEAEALSLARQAEQAHLPERAHLSERARKEERILRILLDKLGQMQPGMPNLLVIHTREELVRAIDLGRLMQAVKTRVEGKDPAFYGASRYSGPAAFYKDFLRLSGILLWASAPVKAPSLAALRCASPLWVNKQARPGLPENVLRVVALASQARSQPSGAAEAGSL